MPSISGGMYTVRKHKRVYEVAKEHRVSSEVLMGILGSLNIEVKRHTDRLEDDNLDRVEQWLEKYPDGTIPPLEAEQEVPPAAPEGAPSEAELEPAAAKLAEGDQTTRPVRRPRRSMPPPEVLPARAVMPPVETVTPLQPSAPVGAKERLGPPRPALERLSARAEEAERAPRQGAARAEPKRPIVGKPEGLGRAERPPSRPGRAQRPPEAEEVLRNERARKSEGTKDEAYQEWTRRRVVIGHGQRARPVGPGTGEAEGAARSGVRRRRGKRRKKPTVSQAEVQANVQRTLAQMDRGRVRRRYDRSSQTEAVEPAEESNVLRVTEFVSVSELADLMGVKATEVIAACLKLGLLVSMNQRLEMDTIQVIADEFGLRVEQMAEKEFEEQEPVEDRPEDLVLRAPVITVMGHVDHGKTSLLDYIRRTNVIAGESGGITQHIGAYEVDTARGRITFLDTPGHEAFTAMRSRGAQVTDVVVLVIAADDNVMPQTVEAINHARAAGVPIVVAINKMDLPTANPQRIRQQLTQHNVVVEDFGGNVQCVEVSAKKGTGIDELLETLALETELLELKANPNREARGTVIEARLDKGRGPAATVLVENGTLRVGNSFLAGMHAGRVRALLDERGNPVEDAGPSRPVQVLGFDDVPTAGDTFIVHESEREARQVAQYRQQLKREQEYSRIKKVSLADLRRRIAEGEIRTLPVIVKGDVDGSVEALSDELARFSNDEVAIEVIHRGVGAINESDVLLASASNAIIIGFHVRPDVRARELAAQENVEIRLYQVIYEAIEELKASLAGLLEARITERVSGTAEVRQLFRVRHLGTVAGCMVRSGIILRASRVRVVRDGVAVYDGKIGTLRRHKDDVREVPTGYECGIWVENFNDVKVGDTIEAYTLVEEARTLETVAG